MLADSVGPAKDAPDGDKITITGVGITYLLGDEFPISVRMACVARFLIEPDDRLAGAPFRIQLRLRDPEGRQTGESTVLSLQPDDLTGHDVHEQEEKGIFFVVDLAPASFLTQGVHQFELLLNDEVVAARTLAVVLEEQTAPPEAAPEASDG